MKLISYFRSLIGKENAMPNAVTADGEVIHSGTDAAKVLRLPSSAEDSMKISAAYRAIKLISEGVAVLPISVVNYDNANRCYRQYYDAHITPRISMSPNGDMTSFEFMRSLVACILTNGNAYVFPRYNSAMYLESLELLNPTSVSHDTLHQLYHVTDQYANVFGTFTNDEILHFKNLGTDGGRSGVSTITMAAEALGIITAADRQMKDTIRNGAKIGGVVSGDSAAPGFGPTTMNQNEAVVEKLNKKLNETNGGHKIVALPTAMKFSPWTLSPKDAEILNSKLMSIKDVARFFCVDPALLYESQNNTYKSGEFPTLMFLKQTLEPILKMIEQELTIKLIPNAEAGWKKITFDREPMYTTDLSTEGAYMSTTIANGIMTINDWRRKKGLLPVAGGDEPIISANVVSLEARLKEGSADSGM